MSSRSGNGRGLRPFPDPRETSEGLSEPQNERLFEVREAVKHRGQDFTLGPIDVSLGPGEILGVMGPNGAGKTTLLKLIWGFFRPDHGSVTALGRTPHLEQIRLRSSAGYLSESPRFYEWMSARRFLSFVAGFYPAWSWERAESLMRDFDLEMTQRIETLSKGNRVKLGLISAVAHQPRLLILDEPTSGLDPLVRRDVLRTLKCLAAEGTGVVLASHVSDDLDQVADSVLMLSKGKTLEYSGTARLLDHYKSSQLEEVFLIAVGRVRTVSGTHRA